MPEVQATSWADKIKAAEEKRKEQNFTELAEGRYNLEIIEAEKRTGKESGRDFINLTTKVIDGDRKNSRVWVSTFPNPASGNAGMFLDLWRAVGYSEQTLIENNPDTDMLASAFVGRQFSADLYYSDRNDFRDNNGNRRPDTRHYRPVEANIPDPEPATAAAPAVAPVAAELPTKPAVTKTSAAPGNPWA